MKSFETIQGTKWKFRLSKQSWPEDQRFTALCVGFKAENEFTFIGDVRFLWPEAFHEFLKQCFPGMFTRQSASYKMAVDNQVRSMYKAWFAEMKNRFMPLINYDRDMYNHQLNAIWRMLPHNVNLLSFEQGLGKTLTSATLSRILDIPRTVIIAPAGVKWNWFHDLVDEWGFDPLTFTILDAEPRKCRHAFMERFVILNYEMVDRHWEYLMEGQRGPIGHIIVDEVHNIKNHKTKRYKGIAKLRNKYPEARVTLLSGTPATNRINDLFAYFKIGSHALGDNQTAFIQRYIEKTKGNRGKVIGAKNLDELRARYSNFMIRKKTEECLDLPQLIEKKNYLDESEITKEYKEHLQSMWENHQAKVEGSNVDELQNQVSGNIHTLNRLLATAKAKLVTKEIDALISEGKKVVIFCGYTAPLDWLENHYQHRCVKINGSVGSHERSLRIDRFINNPKCMVFLGNNKAAGVGINLVNANHVFFLNFPFTPDDLEQPKKRIHRPGQKSTCFINYYIVKNSIDEHIFNIVVDKASDINELLDKGKPGVVDYRQIGSVQNAVFKNLMRQYAKDHGVEVETKFESV